jgi:hypothetical protein
MPAKKYALLTTLIIHRPVRVPQPEQRKVAGTLHEALDYRTQAAGKIL